MISRPATPCRYAFLLGKRSSTLQALLLEIVKSESSLAVWTPLKNSRNGAPDYHTSNVEFFFIDFFRYQFDRVFSPEENNEIVYDDVGKEIIESALDGFNSTIFAYGQTASGKTYTMMGNVRDGGTVNGLISLAVGNIFQAIDDDRDREYLMRVSYMEIYKEKVTDLLAERKDRTKAQWAQIT